MDRSVSIKIGTEYDSDFKEVAKVFVKAMNDICDVAWTTKTFLPVNLHHLVYETIRAKHGLKSNHVCAATKIVSQALRAGQTRARRTKRQQTKPRFVLPTIGYDMRTSKITKDRLSLATLDKRIHVDIRLSPYQLQFFDGSWKIGSSKLIFRDGDWFLNISVSKPAPMPKTSGEVLGVDQGQRHIAVTSANQFLSGRSLNNRTAHLRHIRKELKSKGTPSSRQRLKALSRRENRHRDDVLRCSVKSILNQCEDIAVIVLEDLKKIEKNQGRTRNRQNSNWGFARFREILTYKAEELGVIVDTIDPHYTSQKCSVCGKIKESNRDKKRHLYTCSCGLVLNDDLNAARTIRANYLLANGEKDGASSQPSLDATLRMQQGCIQGCGKPTTSVVGS